MLRSLALALVVLAPALPAQLVKYAPGQYRYSIVNAIKQNEVRGGGKQEYSMTAKQTMALFLAPRDAGSLRMRLTLEAYSLVSDLPIQLPRVEQMNGTVVDGVITTTGRLLRYTHHSPDSATFEVAAVAENMSHFLLYVTPDAVVGKTITDTTSSLPANSGNGIGDRTVTSTTIEGDTVIGGQKAWRIRRETEVQMSGELLQEGRTLQQTGEATGSGYFYVSDAGVYLGSTTHFVTTTTLRFPDGTAVSTAVDASTTVTLVK